MLSVPTMICHPAPRPRTVRGAEQRDRDQRPTTSQYRGASACPPADLHPGKRLVPPLATAGDAGDAVRLGRWTRVDRTASQ